MANGHDRCLGAVANAELADDGADMTFDGFRGHNQVFGDFTVGQAGRQRFENVQFSF